ncbi:MAG: hypothetical protein K9N23_01785 [Akkermansiaceae bacterium]|nr:hypothetical protein [Akkermansiaceae bacterium]MCF7730381.1 hypothetical protein [Akkermansiaceae bacterium]
MLPARTYRAKPDFDESIARIYAWYQQRVIDRPPVRFHHHNVEYEKHRVLAGPWQSAEDRWLDVDFQLKTFTDSLQGAKFLGETFPVFWPNLSALVYNLFLGQEADFDDVTAWVHPCVNELDRLPPLRVQRDNRFYRVVEQLTARALALAEGEFLVGYTDMYAGIDCTASLRGAEQMCLDLLMDPAGLQRLIDAAFSEYAEVYSHFDAVLKSHGQLSVTWMNIPSFETFNVLACDFAVNISPAHFDEFCLPVIRREAECYVHNVFHVDGKGVAKNLDSILTLPNLAAIQWVQGYGPDQPILQWVPLIRKIQQAGKSVVVDLQPAELDEFMKQVDPAGILCWINAEPADQAEILNKVKRW